mgnify:CR=1 FL=1
MTGFLIAGAVLLFFVFLLTVPFHAVISADGELYGHLVTTRNFSLSGELSKFAAALFSTYLG